jgi:hypothetical protein
MPVCARGSFSASPTAKTTSASSPMAEPSGATSTPAPNRP